MRSVRGPRLSLPSRILAFQLAIILGSLLVGAIGSIVVERQRLDQRYEQQALSVAQSVASLPSVRDGLRDSDPSRTLQPLAEGLPKACGALFIVIRGPDGIEFSRPNPPMSGKPIDEDPSAIL